MRKNLSTVEERESMRSLGERNHSSDRLQEYFRSADLGTESMVEMNDPTGSTADEDFDTFTAEESKGVNALKTALYLTLVFSAIGVGIGAFWFINDEKDATLETELQAVSDQAALELDTYIDGISTQLSALSTALSSQYQSSHVGVFPNMTLPFFDQRIRSNEKSEIVFYTPIISSSSADASAEWEQYAILNQGWIDEDLQNRGWDPVTTNISEQIYTFENATSTSSIMTPIWQFSPVPRDRSIVNLDVSTHPILSTLLQTLMSGNGNTSIMSESFIDTFFLEYAEPLSSDQAENQTTPSSFLALPAFKSFDEGAEPFGYVFALISWENALDAAFKDAGLEMIAEIQPSCGTNFYFTIQNGKSRYATDSQDLDTTDADFDLTYDLFENCNYKVVIKPTQAALSEVSTQVPILAFLLIALLFFFLVGLFNQYNRLVRERQIKLLSTAKRSNAVVSSLFPEAVQNRLLAEVEDSGHKQESKRRVGPANFAKMKEFLDDEKGKNVLTQSKPIADFFPEATIMFADLVGFTAWSSMREPTQVFTLLESIYHAFDEIARRRRVFKVETIGDCYVAVAGLPEPCEDHATVMSRFASDCKKKMNDIVKVLEVSLGPDTADLAMRIGLHSGPVTAGVLRGDKARFQLFGDTVNTTSRVETTGKRDMVHISQETADKLMKAGKGHWLTLREDKVTAKGKGELTTYWLNISRKKVNRNSSLGLSSSSTHSRTSDDSVPELLSPSDGEGILSEKHSRLVDWISSELAALLRDVEMRRLASPPVKENENILFELEKESLDQAMKKTPLEEVEEIITLPKLDRSTEAFLNLSESEFGLTDIVVTELHGFVSSVAAMYQDNPFHNFEHASHVTMSVVKLLSRIVSPNIEFDGEDDASKLHDQTYGIASDPLTQFTVVLSALIHDVDHPGVPNTQQVSEQTPLAKHYKNKSIAEQNSVDKSWILLIEGNYPNLRKAIYRTESEFKRFRQLLVNTVMATDIMDKELGASRKARWDKAFDESLHEDRETAANRKATIVIEHIIQASDIAHTMQHWHIYRKWNGRLFEEMYKAFEGNRAQTSPTDTWYKGEMDFFEFYIIPLANKLKDCGVFGVSSDEYLNYAEQNRKEWALNGKTVVGNMVATVRMESTTVKLPGLAPPQLKRNVSGGSKPPVLRTKSSGGLTGTNGTNMMSPFAGSNRKAMLTQTQSIPLPLGADDGDETKSRSSDRSLDANTLSAVGLPSALSLLIVEDEKISRKLFSRAIKKVAPKWTIHEAESGEQALEIVAKATEDGASFDIIFLDQFMGTDPNDLLGSDVVVQMREQGVESVICGMSANDVESLFADAGADAFVFKPLPFRKDALVREMNRIFMHSSTDLSSW